eukprot:8778488-Alexandrium_andersonii.AAC.1
MTLPTSDCHLMRITILSAADQSPINLPSSSGQPTGQLAHDPMLHDVAKRTCAGQISNNVRAIAGNHS